MVTNTVMIGNLLPPKQDNCLNGVYKLRTELRIE